MVHIVEEAGNDLERGDILFDGISGDRVLRRILGRRKFPHLFERNAEMLGVDQAEEGTLPFHGKL